MALCMSNVFLRNNLPSDSGLDAHSEQLLWNLILQLLTDLLTEIVSTRFVNHEGQSIDWVVHQVDDQFIYICFLESIEIILKRTVAMGHGFN